MTLATVIDFPEVADARGCLAFAEFGRHIPFPVERVFYSYAMPPGAERGGHAHRHQHQLLVALSGAFDLVLDDAREQEVVRLDRPSRGVHVPPLIWAELRDFAPGSVCFVFSSGRYDERDYLRDRSAFVREVSDR